MFGCLGAPQQISTGFASCLRYCRDVAHRRSTKLCTMFGHLLGWYIIYIYSLGGCCLLRKFCQLQSSLCVQVLRSSTLAALLHGTTAAASAKLCGAEQRAPSIFCRAAITLGIGPHSSSQQISAFSGGESMHRFRKS